MCKLHSYIARGVRRLLASKPKGNETLYRVAFKSANLIKMSLVTAAAMSAICLLALAETTNTAEATSLPHNGKIAFSSYRPGDDDATIYAVEPDGSNLRQLTNGGYPTWSPDGTQITFMRVEGGVGVLSVVSADGSNLRDLPKNSPYGSLTPTWSPDGTKLAFSSSTSSGSSDIYITDLDGSNQINLTNTDAYSEDFPDFSPNGSQMCFYRQGGTGGWTSGIYIMDAEGSKPTQISEDDSQGGPGVGCDWSPDGTKIAFHAIIPGPDEGDLRKALEKAIAEGDPKKILEKQRKLNTVLDEEVYVINADGSGRTALTSNSGADDVDAEWSPDGTKIAFASNRDGDLDIYTMDADGSNVAQVITNSGVEDVYPDWQPLTPKSGSVKVRPPDTGGPSLLLAASVLLFSLGGLLSAVVKRRM
jgi:Tol biopolymer transport system component